LIIPRRKLQRNSMIRLIKSKRTKVISSFNLDKKRWEKATKLPATRSDWFLYRVTSV